MTHRNGNSDTESRGRDSIGNPQLPHQAAHPPRPRRRRDTVPETGPRRHPDRAFDLPAGCSVTHDHDLVHMLTQLTRLRPKTAVTDYLHATVEETGERPSGVQAYRAGLNPAVSVRSDASGSWPSRNC